MSQIAIVSIGDRYIFDRHVFVYFSHNIVDFVNVVVVFVVVVVVLAVSHDSAAFIGSLAFAVEKVVLMCCCFMLLLYGYKLYKWK